jgi:hypothetical protein
VAEKLLERGLPLLEIAAAIGGGEARHGQGHAQGGGHQGQRAAGCGAIDGGGYCG